MQSRQRYRAKWLRYHKQYERRTFRIFRKVFKDWANNLNTSVLTPLNYQEVTRQASTRESLLKAYADTYLSIGLKHGERIGTELNKIPQQKLFVLDDFKSWFTDFIYNWLNNNKVADLRSIPNTWQQTINKLIARRLEEGATISEIATDIQKMVNRPNFYRWQALRIARTETTAAANLATVTAAQEYDFQVFKEWISANDARTRRIPRDEYDHAIMNGKRVNLDEDFVIPSSNGFPGILSYPGQPRQGQAANIINCRCTVAIIPKRDRDGLLIPK